MTGRPGIRTLVMRWPPHAARLSSLVLALARNEKYGAPMHGWVDEGANGHMLVTKAGRHRSPAPAPLPRRGALVAAGRDQLVNPAVGIRAAAALDADELLAQPGGHRPRRAVPDDPLAAGAAHGTDRGDDRRGAAGEDLGDLAGGAVRLPLLDRDPVLEGGDAQVRPELEQRVAGDAVQQRARGGRGHHPGIGAGTVDEEQVHPAHFLDPAPLGGVEPDHLVAAVLKRLELAGEGGRVVAAALGLAGAAGRGPGVVVGQPDGDRLGGAEIAGR